MTQTTEERRPSHGGGASGAITPTTNVTQHESLLHVSARIYANSGLYVFPLIPGKKEPLTTNGFKDASNDMDQVNAWWTRWPEANIGLDCGRSKIIVIDVDPRNGGRESLTRLQNDLPSRLPRTTAVHTGRGDGGLHIWFSGFRQKGKFHKYPGLDIQANGGYVVVPPSIHPDSGQPYIWADDIGCGFFTGEAPWTDDLEKLATKEEYVPIPGGVQIQGDGHRYALAAMRGELDTLLNTREGGRNNQLNISAIKIWGYVRSGLLPEIQTWDIFMDAGRSIGLTTVEITKTLCSASGAARPRTGGTA